MNDATSPAKAAAELATILDELEADAVEGCVLEAVVLHGLYTDGRGGYAGNLRRSLTPAALRAITDRSRLLERRHDAIWGVVLELRQKATAEGRDPYQDPTAQALSAILTGCASGGWEITYGTLVESRDDLDAAKARAVDLWERHKFEAEEHAHDWEEWPGGALALVAWDEEQWFDCGPVIRPLAAAPQPQIAGQGMLPVETAGSATVQCASCRGTGSHREPDPVDQEFESDRECMDCDGTGRVARGYRIGDLVQITGRGVHFDGKAGVVTEIDDNPEYPIGLTVEGFIGLVWCNSDEIRHLDAAEAAAEAVSDEFLIWSHEHAAWWRTHRLGYTHEITKAGRYCEDDAKRICTDAAYRWMRGAKGPWGEAPPEVTIPAHLADAWLGGSADAGVVLAAIDDATAAAIKARDEARSAT